MKQNYQLILDKTLNNIVNEGIKPKLLLHSCCAPCSSYVIEYLNIYFDITLYFYNPNISPKSEYDYRLDELQRLCNEMTLKNKPNVVGESYEPDVFYNIVKGYESLPEGSDRCFKCYKMRLEKSAQYAKDNCFDYFCTTLSISPYKNADKLNEIGEQLAEQYGVEYLSSDFKKKNGYKRSIELSKQYNLYRQNYCGCVYSQAVAEQKFNNKTNN